MATSALHAGSHSVYAVYTTNASGFINSSDNADPLAETIQAAGTTTTIAGNVATAAFGQSVSFTATVAVVSPGTGTPTGSVQFVVNGADYESAVTLDANGQAVLSTSALPAGSHNVYAVYTSNDSDFGNSDDSASPLAETINAAGTATAVASSATTSIVGESLTLTATVAVVSPGMGTPTGSVQFVVDGSEFGSPVTLNATGQAVLATSALGIGPHTVSALYDSNSVDFSASTANSISLFVGHATATALTSSASSISVGQAVVLTASVVPVEPDLPTPTGEVQFMDGNSLLQMVTLSQGVASYTASALTAGTHDFTAVYEGDGVSYCSSVSAVGPGSVITTFAGGGDPGDGGLATAASIRSRRAWPSIRPAICSSSTSTTTASAAWTAPRGSSLPWPAREPRALAAMAARPATPSWICPTAWPLTRPATCSSPIRGITACVK